MLEVISIASFLLGSVRLPSYGLLSLHQLNSLKMPAPPTFILFLPFGSVLDSLLLYHKLWVSHSFSASWVQFERLSLDWSSFSLTPCSTVSIPTPSLGDEYAIAEAPFSSCLFHPVVCVRVVVSLLMLSICSLVFIFLYLLLAFKLDSPLLLILISRHLIILTFFSRLWVTPLSSLCRPSYSVLAA